MVEPEGNPEKPERTEYQGGRNQPQIGAQLFSLPLWPRHAKPWHHLGAAARRTGNIAFTTTADIQLTNRDARKLCLLTAPGDAGPRGRGDKFA
ncbi:MAG: hypothetical protein WB989_18595 [Mycobacterium sp.]